MPSGSPKKLVKGPPSVAGKSGDAKVDLSTQFSTDIIATLTSHLDSLLNYFDEEGLRTLTGEEMLNVEYVAQAMREVISDGWSIIGKMGITRKKKKSSDPDEKPPDSALSDERKTTIERFEKELVSLDVMVSDVLTYSVPRSRIEMYRLLVDLRPHF